MKAHTGGFRQPAKQIALIQWSDADGVTRVIQQELEGLGFGVKPFRWDQPVPGGVDRVLSFAPYGKFLHIPRQLAGLPEEQRPQFIHWNFESLPNIRLPSKLLTGLGAARSWVGRLNDTQDAFLGVPTTHLPLSRLRMRANKYKYLGDYHYGWRQGWFGLLADISMIFADFHQRHGVPSCFIPWGTPPEWHADLRLERDIDVLWIGKRRTRRRARLLDQLIPALRQHGVRLFVADGIERPFIYDEERTEILNRAKITLNLLPESYDPALLFRFHMAAGNRSLVVSEPCLPHNPDLQPGVHYIDAPVGGLVETIQYYLEHEAARREIAEHAHRLVTGRLTLRNSLRALIGASER